MASMNDVLASIPGYGAYIQRRQMNEQAGMQDLQQAGALQAILASIQNQQATQEDRALRATRGQPIGSGGLLLPDKTVIPPAARPDASMKAAPVRQRYDGENVIQEELQADGSWKEVGRGPRFAKSVEPSAAAPVPVTPVTLQDPNDPSGTIVVDGRTRAVLGKGPKLTDTGKSDQKLRIAQPQAKLRVGSMTQNMDRLEAALEELHNDPGLPNITGPVAGRTYNVTGKATSAQAKLETIKSQIFQESLQAMREASKTGGAVGNVSDREGDKLQNTLAALDQAQTTGNFKLELKKAVRQLRISKELLRNAYDEQFGGMGEDAAPAPSAAPAAPQAQRKTSKSGRPIVSNDGGKTWVYE